MPTVARQTEDEDRAQRAPRRPGTHAPTRALTLALCGLFASSAAAGESQDPTAKAPPCTLPDEPPEELVLPKYGAFRAPNPTYRVERLYPLGWSPRGHFAWITAEYRSTIGRTLVTFVVANAVANSDYEGTNDTFPYTREGEPEPALKAFWNSNHEKICASVAKHGIVLGRVELTPLPLAIGGDSVDAAVESPPAGSGDASPRVSVRCVSKKRGVKELEAFTPDVSLHGPRRIAPLYAIRGPRPDLVLFVFENQQPQPKGEPTLVSFFNYGCDVSQIGKPAEAPTVDSPPCPMPRELVIPAYAKYRTDTAEIIVSRVYPMGWSPKGLFAFASTHFSDSAGFTTASFGLLDTKTDEYVKGLKGFDVDYVVEAHDERNGAMAAFWKDKGQAICATLAAHGVSQDPGRFVTLPVELDGERVDAYLAPASPQARADEAGELSLMCRTSRKGEKRIATLTSVATPWGVRTPSVVGAFVNPSRQRLLVMTASQVPGGEGPPDHLSFRYFGCDLTKFRSPTPPR